MPPSGKSLARFLFGLAVALAGLDAAEAAKSAKTAKTAFGTLRGNPHDHGTDDPTPAPSLGLDDGAGQIWAVQRQPEHGHTGHTGHTGHGASGAPAQLEFVETSGFIPSTASFQVTLRFWMDDIDPTDSVTLRVSLKDIDTSQAIAYVDTPLAASASDEPGTVQVIFPARSVGLIPGVRYKLVAYTFVDVGERQVARLERLGDARVDMVAAADLITASPPVLGADRDEHGCVGTDGYEWCPGSTSCVRRFEMAGVDFDTFCATASGETTNSNTDANTGVPPTPARSPAAEDAGANFGATTPSFSSDDHVSATTAAPTRRAVGIDDDVAARDLGAVEGAAGSSESASQREASQAGTAVGVVVTMLAVAVFVALMRQRQAAGYEPKQLEQLDTYPGGGTVAAPSPDTVSTPTEEKKEEEIYEVVVRSRRAREPLPVQPAGRSWTKPVPPPGTSIHAGYCTAATTGTDGQYERPNSRGTPSSPIYAVSAGAGSPCMDDAYDIATVEGQLPGQPGTDVAYDVANLQPGTDLAYDVANSTGPGHDYRIDTAAQATPKATDYRVEVADYRQAPGAIYQLGTPEATVMSPPKVLYDHANDDLSC